MKKFLCVFLVIMAGTLVSAQDLRELGKGLLSNLFAQKVDDLGSDNFRRVADQAIDHRNYDQNRDYRTFRLPSGAVLAVEIDENQTRFSDRKIASAIKAAAQAWGSRLRIGISFSDRETLKERNAADRDNPELRNPTPAGRAWRADYELHVVAREGRGIDSSSGSGFLGRWWSGFSGAADLARELDYIELDVEVRCAAEQTTEQGGTLSVVGADLTGYRVNGSFSTGNLQLEYTRSSDQDNDQALRDAARRLTKVFLGSYRERKRG